MFLWILIHFKEVTSIPLYIQTFPFCIPGSYLVSGVCYCLSKPHITYLKIHSKVRKIVFFSLQLREDSWSLLRSTNSCRNQGKLNNTWAGKDGKMPRKRRKNYQENIQDFDWKSGQANKKVKPTSSVLNFCYSWSAVNSKDVIWE